MKLKKRVLTPAEVIQVEQNKVAESFGLFTKLRNDIADSIDRIHEAKKESIKRKESLLAQVEQEHKTIELADAEMQVQSGLLLKVEEFIPQGVSK
jgi:hypothetical protein